MSSESPVNRRLIGCALAFLLVGCGMTLDRRPLTMTAGMVLIATALLMFSTSLSKRSSSVIRLDWFMRVLRRQGTQNALYRFSRRILPAAWFSDRTTKRRGSIRRWLRGLGVSWLASPVRRLMQAACLSAFLLMFLYVCWPYSARPTPPARGISGMALVELDESGRLHLRPPDQAPRSQSNWIQVDAETFLLADTADSPAADHQTITSAWTIEHVGDDELVLRPSDDLEESAFQWLLTHEGTWGIYESDPNAWPTHYADHLHDKELAPAETFLLIDPLVSISTAVASRSWVWSLTSAGIILLVCVLIPRGFCGYLCPLGTTIDLFDWAVAGRVKRFRVPDGGWWVHIKYYLLAGIMLSAVMGVLLSGIFAAIPVVTRAALFALEPLQTGTARGWHLVPAMHSGHFISLALFATILSLGFLRPRFWCKYVCPSGAVFSLGNLFRVTERKVEDTCIHCNKCVEICPFDAIKADFTTRTTDCTMCQSCAGVCPTEAIKFVERWNTVSLKQENDPETHETALGRRGFLSLAAGGAAAIVGGAGASMAVKATGAETLEQPLVRPPGSVPEQEFLEMCIRCGECFKACPNNVLQAEGFQQGFEGLWAPMVVADWAGCESSCNNCGQVCPTGAIRSLPMEEKRVARMGLAIVNRVTCLPIAGTEACDLCVQECHAAGYHAIEYQQVGTEVDDEGRPIEGTGLLAPVVLADACVGCGLCQTRCYAINVKERHVLTESAIVIEAGEGYEDRIMDGSYVELRRERELKARQTQPATATESTQESYFVPGADDGPNENPNNQDQNNPDLPGNKGEPATEVDDPFGLGQ